MRQLGYGPRVQRTATASGRRGRMRLIASTARAISRNAARSTATAWRCGGVAGYATLCALTFRDAFEAGAGHYGISDLEALAKDTHKLELRYLDRLIGSLPRAARYFMSNARRFIFH